jgi:tRNA pseudouridine13 synthase
MKIKQLPQDFCVEEVPSLTWTQEKAAHAVYLMEKQDIDTFNAIRTIAHKLRLPAAEIGYAGLKDKHAQSIQYITIPTHCNIETMKLPGITLKRIGYTTNKIQIGDLQGNTFTITIRDLREPDLKPLPQKLDSIRADGVPNYFDSQRFGSVINNIFISKLLIQGDDEAAVKQFLTAYQKSEPLQTKNEKRRIADHWNHLSSYHPTDRILGHVIDEYKATKSWQKAYLRIPNHLREIHANAYQSYLWNETLKEILLATINPKKLFPTDYAAGTLLFPDELTPKEKEAIPKTLYTASENAVYSGLELTSFKKILSREHINQTDFAKLAAYDQYLKARPRDTIITPANLTASEPLPDELNTKPNEQRLKIQLTFTLPKGSYATIVTKRLFDQ